MLLGLLAYWGSIGIMEKKMETLGPFKGIYRVLLGYILRYILGLMENQMEKKMEHEMETREYIRVDIGGILG